MVANEQKDLLLHLFPPAPSPSHFPSFPSFSFSLFPPIYFLIGRIEYIRSQFGMTASQLQYCHPALSPECVMIVATAKRKVGEHKN